MNAVGDGLSAVGHFIGFGDGDTPAPIKPPSSNVEDDPEAQLRIKQAKAEAMQAKGQASQIFTSGAGINPSLSTSSRATLMGE